MKYSFAASSILPNNTGFLLYIILIDYGVCKKIICVLPDFTFYQIYCFFIDLFCFLLITVKAFI